MAEFFVLIRTWQHPFEPKKATVYIKDGLFFREQGGTTQDWGQQWQRVEAEGLADAYTKAHASVGTTPPPQNLAHWCEADARAGLGVTNG